MFEYKPQLINPELLRRVVKLDAPTKPKEIRDTNGTGLVLRHEPRSKACEKGRLNFYIQVARSKRARPFGKRCDARRVLEGKPTLATVKAEALRLRAAFEDDIDIAADRRAAKSVPTFSDFLKDTYEPWALDEMQDGAGTVARLKSCFEKDFGNKRLTEITKAETTKWKAKRRKAGVTDETINRDLTALRAALYDAVDEFGIIKESPLARLKMSKVDANKRVVRALGGDEKAQLLEALKARDDAKRQDRVNGNQWREKRGRELLPPISRFADVLTPAVIVSLETGLRRGELFKLKWPMVDFKHKLIYIKGETTKSYLTRQIPMNTAAHDALRDWWMQSAQPKTGYVFTNRGKAVKNLRHSYYAVLKAAGIKRFNSKGEKIDWHSLRHSFGTGLGKAHVDIVTIKELMGHADIRTTQRYLQTDDARKLEAVERLHA